MRRALLVAILLVSFVTAAAAQEDGLETILSFEGPLAGVSLNGWGGGPPATLFADSVIVHGGAGAARLERTAADTNSFSVITRRYTVDFTGQSVELRGFLRTAGVTGFAGLWLRQDGPNGTLKRDNMRNQGLRGTHDWAEYSVRQPLDPEARELFYGALVTEEGTVWADDLQLLVDGRPIGQAPKLTREPTVLDTDQEFTADSRIGLSGLDAEQTARLALLGRVWGFLKYHHPAVVAGERQWDFELFRVLPDVLAAVDTPAVRSVLVAWVDALGPLGACAPCAEAPQDVHLQAPVDWIRDAGELGPELAARLQAVYAARPAADVQFYVTHAPIVGNPIFARELGYREQRAPDAGFRILALFRYWNIIEYWFPYRDQIDDDWTWVLTEFLPRFVQAEGWDAYRLELLALIARVRDGHANLWTELAVRPPRGDCRWPVALRMVEERLTVAAYVDSLRGPASGLEIGDVIETLDGVPVADLFAAWSPYYCASNRSAQVRDQADFFSRGECGPSTVTIERGGERRTLQVERLAGVVQSRLPHDRPGPAFQLLSDEVAYLKLSSVKIQEIDAYLARSEGTRGLVIDLRNYPSEFVVFALGSRLVDESTPFARFTVGDQANPGAFTWTEPQALDPQEPRYAGRVAILVDEVSMSQSEYTTLALSAGPRAVVVGSPTVGADGNVSQIPLPGGIKTMISGIGVFYPDKTPTQRVGIVPDIAAAPTVAGLREGRDEVLEAALRHLLGPGADETLIRRLARPGPGD